MCVCVCVHVHACTRVWCIVCMCVLSVNEATITCESLVLLLDYQWPFPCGQGVLLAQERSGWREACCTVKNRRKDRSGGHVDRGPSLSRSFRGYSECTAQRGAFHTQVCVSPMGVRWPYGLWFSKWGRAWASMWLMSSQGADAAGRGATCWIGRG